MSTGYTFHEYYLWHDTGTDAQMLPPDRFVEPGRHVETPESKRRLHSLIHVSGLHGSLVAIEPQPVTMEDLARVHTRRHIENVIELSKIGGVHAGPQAPIGRGSYEVALLSAGGAYAAMAAVAGGRVDNAYALVRPPGHHAEPDTAMGFCLFNNVAVAIRRLQAEAGLERIAVVDWDVHHGNGTEASFYDDPSVLTISIHQDSLYPTGRGRIEDFGRGAGEGFNLNIPLPPGSGAAAYEAVFDRVVMPALHAFQPEIIVVACGLDASAFDPLGRMMLNSECYRRLTDRVMAASRELCGGRLVMSHEGGYSEGYVPYCGLAVIEAMSGIRTEVVDPIADHIDEWGCQGLQPHQDTAITAAEALVPQLAKRLGAKA